MTPTIHARCPGSAPQGTDVAGLLTGAYRKAPTGPLRGCLLAAARSEQQYCRSCQDLAGSQNTMHASSFRTTHAASPSTGREPNAQPPPMTSHGRRFWYKDLFTDLVAQWNESPQRRLCALGLSIVKP